MTYSFSSDSLSEKNVPKARDDFKLSASKSEMRLTSDFIPPPSVPPPNYVVPKSVSCYSMVKPHHSSEKSNLTTSEIIDENEEITPPVPKRPLAQSAIYIPPPPFEDKPSKVDKLQTELETQKELTRKVSILVIYLFILG